MSSFSIPYGKQEITDEDIKYVNKVLKADFLTQGPEIEKFENNFSKRINASYSSAVSNGTAALHLAVKALGLKEGQKVISTPITFAASSNCVLYNGGQLDFADIDKNALIDFNQIEDKLKNSKKGEYAGIIAVSFGGLPIDTIGLNALAKKYGLWTIEDACHAPGGYTNNNDEKIYAGSSVYTDASVFSFHPVKHIACGEGGMVTTKNKETDSKIRSLRTHGITKDPDLLIEKNEGPWYYEMQDLGYNYRLTDIQAALGICQLEKLTSSLNKRLKIAQRYIKAFKNVDGLSIAQEFTKGHAYHLFIIRTKKRLELYQHLRSKGIYTQVHYIPIPSLPYYVNLGHDINEVPKSLNYYQECLSLPMYPTLSEEELEYVIQSVYQFYE